MVGRAEFNFIFGLLISEPGWVGSLSDQPVVGRTESGWVTRFDNSTYKPCLIVSLYY